MVHNKKKKPRCSIGGCRALLTPTQVMIGACRSCSKSYCAEHRLPEAHGCATAQVSDADKAKVVDSMRCAPRKIDTITSEPS